MNDLHALFNPRSVAVIGASSKPGKIGYSIVENLKESGYTGKIYPVNPNATEILGYPCFPSVKDIGQPVDEAIITVPAKLVLNTARECGEAGVKFLVVITAGFKEIGGEGVQREQELVNICRQYNMRMVGPNVVGITDTNTPLNASFAPGAPLQGKIAFISQSGAMLIAILDWSRSAGIGFSQFVSMGNKADLNEVDFIWCAAQDPNTSVILCYLEDVTDGDRFLEVATEASKIKPVIILKSGTSKAGARAASSHTGALAGSDLAYETAFKQCGVIRANTMSELFDLAVAFINQPVPKNSRVAIVTNSGGPGIIATDSVESYDLKMSRFNRQSKEYFKQNLPAESSFYNPVDLLGDASHERYRLAMETILADENTDTALILLSPTAVIDPLKTAEIILEMRKIYPDKPVFTSFMGGERISEGNKLLSESGIPCYTFPEPALQAISGMVKYSKLREKVMNTKPLAPAADVDKEAVRKVFAEVVKDGRTALLGYETTKVAEAYKIPVAPVYLAKSPDEAVELANKLGYPVVLKIASPEILHKSDVGGVKIGLETAQEVKEAYQAIMDSVSKALPDAPIYGIEVQKMMPKGTEILIGMIKDAQFGPMIAFGMGGIYVNLLKDASFRLAKCMTREDIEEMMTETKAYTLLKGYRGSEPADLPSIVDAIARVTQLSLDFAEIAEIDLNPVVAYPDGAAALDVKITLNGEAK